MEQNVPTVADVLNEAIQLFGSFAPVLGVVFGISMGLHMLRMVSRLFDDSGPPPAPPRIPEQPKLKLEWCERCENYVHLSDFYPSVRICKACVTSYAAEQHALKQKQLATSKHVMTGRTTVLPKVCPNVECGSENDTGATFCIYCGYQFPVEYLT